MTYRWKCGVGGKNESQQCRGECDTGDVNLEVKKMGEMREREREKGRERDPRIEAWALQSLVKIS